MSTPFVTPTSASAQTRANCAGTWKLQPGHAITLTPRADSRLRAVNGGLWVTFDGPHSGPGNASGDLFLLEGQSITLSAGRRAVVEPWGRAPFQASYFGWDVLAASVQPPLRAASHWQLGVRQPLADLRAGLALTGTALARLLAGLAAEVLAGVRRGAGLRALTAASSASKAQGCIS